MADQKFFQKSQNFTLAEIAKLSGAELGEGAKADFILEDVAALSEAGATDLSFLDNVKYREALKNTKAGACFIHPDQLEHIPSGVQALVTPTPYKSYALAAQAFYSAETPNANISEQATIHPSASIGEGCTIEAGAVIGEGVKIGANSWIGPNVSIDKNVEIGAHCRIGANATLSHCIIKDRTRLYPGVRVGQDGFGFAIDPKGHVKVPQLGRVIIEEHVEIGANTTIDRGAGPDTIIGQGTWIDNLVQIGHNVKIGKGCVIVAQVGISGSAVIEDFVAIGGQVGIAGHLNIGAGAKIAAQSGVMRDIPAGEEHLGSPSMPIREKMKEIALLKRLINKEK